MWYMATNKLAVMSKHAGARAKIYHMPHKKIDSAPHPVEAALKSLKNLETVSVCGRGGSGTVYHCVPNEKGRSVEDKRVVHYAVKVAHSSIPNGQAALMKEWSILSRIQNYAWAPKLMDRPWEGAHMGIWLSGGECKFLGVVMEYFHTDMYTNDLDFWTVQTVPVAMLMEFIDCLLKVLSELHSLKLQHRDIKDTNMCWTRRAPCSLKLTDYGGTVQITRPGPSYGQPRLTVPDATWDEAIDYVLGSRLREQYPRDKLTKYISAPKSGQLECVGESGSRGYRQVDIDGKVNTGSLDTFAVGVLICHAATSCATRQVWSHIWDWCDSKEVDRKTAEIIWTECLKKVVISTDVEPSSDDERWVQLMTEVWGSNPGFSELRTSMPRIRRAVKNLVCDGNDGSTTYDDWRALD
jgi:serine/threonine protein kinase